MKLFNKKKETYICLNMAQGHVKSINRIEDNERTYFKGEC